MDRFTWFRSNLDQDCRSSSSWPSSQTWARWLFRRQSVTWFFLFISLEHLVNKWRHVYVTDNRSYLILNCNVQSWKTSFWDDLFVVILLLVFVMNFSSNDVTYGFSWFQVNSFQRNLEILKLIWTEVFSSSDFPLCWNSTRRKSSRESWPIWHNTLGRLLQNNLGKLTRFQFFFHLCILINLYHIKLD